jgi:hypothetical protein
MKRSLTLAAAAVAGATVLGLAAPAAPAAHAASADARLYPQSGRIYIDPVTVRVLAATPSGDLAGAGADLVLSTSGPSTTVAVLNSVEHLLKNDVQRAARIPGISVEYQWQITDGGTVVNNASRLVRR